jgi:hypothetical protein
MRQASYFALLALAAAWLCAGQATAEIDDPGKTLVEEVNNPRPTFQVQVSVNHPSGYYRGGDTVEITVRSEKTGYLYLFDVNPEGKLYCIFPSKRQPDNRIRAGRAITVPPNNKTVIRVRPPYGHETIKAVVTTRPIKALKVRKLIEADVTPVTPQNIKDLREELNTPTGVHVHPDFEWGEHFVRIITLDPVMAPPAELLRIDRGVTRRVGLFVGISTFADRRIRGLPVCREDARRLAAVMKEQGHLDKTIVLTDREATKDKIQQAICQTLARETGPGDTVFLYFSSHGGRWQERDGQAHDYLAPYDTQTASLWTTQETTISDELLTRWLQCLNRDQRVTVVLDACHAEGMAGPGRGLDPDKEPFFARLARNIRELSKDFGQNNLALLASCRVGQPSYVRKERDHSVMTYYLIDQLRGRKGRLTLADWYRNVKPEVEVYVLKQYRGSQTPVLVGDNVHTVIVRP